MLENKLNADKTFVKMNLEGGVYKIPVYEDNVLISFIFDSGASLISISITETSILYNQGSLTKEDILDKGQFMDANSDISEGTINNLDEVKIGDRVLRNVLACVSEGQSAPLLFGQSALQKFGKISIEYNLNEIIFEK